MELLGLSEDELCATLDVDALTLLSGTARAQCRAADPARAARRGGRARRRAGAQALGTSVGAGGRPIDALISRDFGAFEDALAELEQRGFVLEEAAADG